VFPLDAVDKLEKQITGDEADSIATFATGAKQSVISGHLQIATPIT
jgi:hypothetical protein